MSVEESKGWLSQPTKEMLSGGFTGILKVYSGQPFDITKIRMQAMKDKPKMMEVVKGIWKNEGPLAFYKGSVSPLAGISFMLTVQFSTLEATKRYFKQV